MLKIDDIQDSMGGIAISPTSPKDSTELVTAKWCYHHFARKPTRLKRFLDRLIWGVVIVNLAITITCATKLLMG
jgi:hypothetical protein